MGVRLIRRFGLLAVGVGVALVILAPMASAQTDYPTTSTTPTTGNCATGVVFVVHGDVSGLPAQATNTTVDVCGTSVTNPLGVTVKAASATSGSLAFTGGNMALLVGLGLVAAVGGVVLVRLGRRSGATH
jgi:hypothetical protein